MNANNRFILKPDFFNLGELGLHYKDLITYITIRSFHNSNEKYCYPSYRAISKLSGLSTKFIGQSVKRLKEAEILNVWTVGKRSRFSYWYAFDIVPRLSKVPFELLNNTDLTANEKGMLILLSEYCKSGYCSDSITKIADKTGFTYKMIDCQYQSLLLKGFLVESMYEDPLTNTLTKLFNFTNKLKWNHSNYDASNKPVKKQPIEDLLKSVQSAMRLKIIASRQ